MNDSKTDRFLMVLCGNTQQTFKETFLVKGYLNYNH